MGWFTLVGLLIVILVGCVIARSIAASPEGKLGAVGVAVLCLLVFIGITIVMSTETVENGHIGIKKQFGSLVGTTPEGFVNFPPWQSVDQVSVRNEIRTYHMDDRSGGGDASSGSAVSADSQPVFLDIQVNYSLVQAGAVDLYRETGGQYVQRILDPAVFQDVKEVTAKYKAIDFAKNREKIRLEIEEKLQGEVGRVTTKDGKQLEAIRINNVALKNVDFTEALSKAIEQTVEAEQQAKREQARVQIVSAQADQAVALATGEKLSAIQRAQGTAQSTLIQARADATANRLRSRTLSPILVQNNAIEKLNPNVSVIICPPRTTCFPGVTNPPVAGG